MTYEGLFRYARRYADRKEAAGMGSQFPTVRQAAKRFGVPQAAVLMAMECHDASEIPGADYFQLAVGILTGGGHAAFDDPADFQLEAYRKPAALDQEG